MQAQQLSNYFLTLYIFKLTVDNLYDEKLQRNW